jgi:hypothetical protein
MLDEEEKQKAKISSKKAMQEILNQEENQRLEMEKQEKIRLEREKRFAEKCKAENKFRLNNGGEIESLDDLIQKIPFINNDEFAFHTRSDQQNFSKWILHVFKNPKLAENIKEARDKQEMIKILKEFKRGG